MEENSTNRLPGFDDAVPVRTALLPETPASAPRHSRRRMYTLGETAALLGIGRSTAYDLAQRGELKVVKLGGRRLVSPTVLEALLGERPPPPDQLDD